jgi:hypothetical protein
VDSSIRVDDGEEHGLVVSLTGTTVSLYCDGRLAGVPAALVIAPQAVNMAIGASGTPANYFTGAIMLAAAFPYPLVQLQAAELNNRMRMYSRLD